MSRWSLVLIGAFVALVAMAQAQSNSPAATAACSHVLANEAVSRILLALRPTPSPQRILHARRATDSRPDAQGEDEDSQRTLFLCQLHESAALLEQLVARSPESYDLYQNLGFAYLALGRAEAWGGFRTQGLARLKGVAERIEASGGPSRLLAETLRECAFLHAHGGDRSLAVSLQRRVVEVEDTINPANPEPRAWLGYILIERGEPADLAEAVGLLRSAADSWSSSEGVGSFNALWARRQLAAALTRQGRADEAEVLYRDILVTHEQVFGADHLETSRTAFAYARWLRDQRRESEAVQLAERSLAVRQARLPADHCDIAEIESWLRAGPAGPAS